MRKSFQLNTLSFFFKFIDFFKYLSVEAQFKNSNVDDESINYITSIKTSNFLPDIYEDAISHFSSPFTLVKEQSRTRRTAIEPRRAKFNFKSLVTLLKNASLGEYSLPVSAGFNEPISYLQKACEGMQFSYLLDKAAECQDSLEQMVYVTAFEISLGSVFYDRTAKPFTPLLNETYECDRTQDLGWRFMSEYYAHYPPTYASVSY